MKDLTLFKFLCRSFTAICIVVLSINIWIVYHHFSFFIILIGILSFVFLFLLRQGIKTRALRLVVRIAKTRDDIYFVELAKLIRTFSRAFYVDCRFWQLPKSLRDKLRQKNPYQGYIPTEELYYEFWCL